MDSFSTGINEAGYSIKNSKKGKDKFLSSI
jgi:hypothetical protein